MRDSDNLRPRGNSPRKPLRLYVAASIGGGALLVMVVLLVQPFVHRSQATVTESAFPRASNQKAIYIAEEHYPVESLPLRPAPAESASVRLAVPTITPAPEITAP